MEREDHLRVEALGRALQFAEVGIRHGGVDNVKAENIVASAKVFYEFLKGESK